VIDAIEDLFRFAPGENKIGLAQYAELLRQAGLDDAGRHFKVANAALAAGQRAEQVEPHGVGDRAEKFCMRFDIEDAQIDGHVQPSSFTGA
jgi:hypothetical protein